MTPIWAPYGTAYTFRAPIVTANSTNFANAWTATAGTVKIIRDGTTLGNVTTLPTVVSSQYTYSWPLSGTEMTADEVIIQVVDRTNVTDQAFRIITLPDGALRSRLAQAGNATTITLDASAVATDNYYNGSVVAIIAGTGNAQARVITAYTGSSKVATVDTNWATNPSTDSVFAIYPQGIYGLTSAQVEAAVMDTANGIETGLTMRQAMRVTTTMVAGVRTGIGTTTEVYRSAVSNSTARVTFAFPATNNANPSSITYSLS